MCLFTQSLRAQTIIKLLKMEAIFLLVLKFLAVRSFEASFQNFFKKKFLHFAIRSLWRAIVHLRSHSHYGISPFGMQSLRFCPLLQKIHLDVGQALPKIQNLLRDSKDGFLLKATFLSFRFTFLSLR